MILLVIGSDSNHVLLNETGEDHLHGFYGRIFLVHWFEKLKKKKDISLFQKSYPILNIWECPNFHPHLL